MYFEYVGPVPDTQSNKEKSCCYCKRAPLTTFAHRGFYSSTYLVGEVRDHPLRCFLGLSVCRSGARERGSTDRPVQRPAAPPRNPGIPRSTVSHHRWSSVYDKHTIKYTTEAGGQTRVWKVRSQLSLGERERPEGVRWYAWHRHAALSPHGSTFSQHGRRCVRYGGLYKAHIHDIQSSHVHR